MVSKQIARAALAALKREELIVYPTDTAYALGCDATSRAAVLEVYRIKVRHARKPLATIAASTAMVEKFFRVSKRAALLMRKFWPGPLTLVLPVRDPLLRRALGAAVGVRVPASPYARALARRLGRPIVATSANRAGRGNAYTLRGAMRKLGTRGYADITMVPGGRLARRPPSTVIELQGSRLVVHRRGPINF